MQTGFRIAAIGELLWDFLPGGPQLGGAPANFAAMCANLAAADSTNPADEILLVSRVGDDPLGRQALEQLAAAGVKPDHISIDSSHATGTVTVEFTSDASPIYRIHDDVAWDYIPGNIRTGFFCPNPRRRLLRHACAAVANNSKHASQNSRGDQLPIAACFRREPAGSVLDARNGGLGMRPCQHPKNEP